jgi:antitoxin component YwqK of YwqJK toxin-antitoxin module
MVLYLVTLAGCMTTEVRDRHYPNGALEARTRVHTTAAGDVIAHGEYTEWFESGEKAKQGRFVKGKPHGKWTTWYESGRRKSVENYDHGRRCGDSTFWYENGQESRRVSYVDGRKHGTEIEWFPGGEKKWEAHYEHGAIQRFDSWNAAGQRVQSFSTERGYSDKVERDYVKVK